MPAQKREPTKNFIAILSESSEAHHTAERPAKMDRPYHGAFRNLGLSVR